MELEKSKFKVDLSPQVQPSGHVNTIAFSLDGQWLAVGETAGKVLLYRARSLELDASFFPDPSTLHSNCRTVAFSKDFLATGTDSGSIALYEMGSWRELARQVEGPMIYSVDFSANGSWLAAGADNPHLILYRVVNWEREKRCKLALGNGIYCVRWSPLSVHMIVAGDDTGLVTVIDVSTLQRMYTLPRQSLDPVMSMEFSPEGDTLMTCRQGGLLTLWDAHVWQKKAHRFEEDSDLSCIGFIPLREVFIIGGESSFILCSVHGDVVSKVADLPVAGTCMSISPCGMCLAVGGVNEKGGGTVTLHSEEWYMALHAGSEKNLIRLANQGCCEAMYCLGIAYAQGKLSNEDITRNDTEAAIWFRRAAAEGFAGGGRPQDELGQFHNVGEDKIAEGESSQRPELVWSQVADMEQLKGRSLSHLHVSWKDMYDQTVTSLAERSITFGELLQIHENTKHKMSRNPTTRNVVKSIVKPITAPTRVSYAERLSEDRGRRCGVADFYMIHAWDMLFEDLLISASIAVRGGGKTPMQEDLLAASSYSEKELDVRLWICALCVNQHQDQMMTVGHPGRETDKFENVLQILKAQGKKAILALDKFNTTLERIWCLDEVHECIEQGVEVLYHGSCHGAVNRNSFKSVADCNASVASDKERILRKIQQHMTIHSFDDQLFRVISEGIFEELKRQEQSALAQQQQNQLKMEAALRSEMKQVSMMTGQVKEQELQLETTMQNELQHVHGDVDSLQTLLRDAQSQIGDMQKQLTLQARDFEERDAAAKRTESEMRSEIGELFSEMREIRVHSAAQYARFEDEQASVVREELNKCMDIVRGELSLLRSDSMERTQSERSARSGAMQDATQRRDDVPGPIRRSENSFLDDEVQATLTRVKVRASATGLKAELDGTESRSGEQPTLPKKKTVSMLPTLRSSMPGMAPTKSLDAVTNASAGLIKNLNSASTSIAGGFTSTAVGMIRGVNSASTTMAAGLRNLKPIEHSEASGTPSSP